MGAMVALALSRAGVRPRDGKTQRLAARWGVGADRLTENWREECPVGEVEWAQLYRASLISGRNRRHARTTAAYRLGAIPDGWFCGRRDVA